MMQCCHPVTVPCVDLCTSSKQKLNSAWEKFEFPKVVACYVKERSISFMISHIDFCSVV